MSPKPKKFYVLFDRPDAEDGHVLQALGEHVSMKKAMSEALRGWRGHNAAIFSFTPRLTAAGQRVADDPVLEFSGVLR